jgi:deazaflavin-dependent oxidoreductase (nitroreductase family)
MNRVVLPLVRRGVGSPLPIGIGLTVLETRGRKSGKLRQVPLVATRIGSKVNVSTFRSDSQWIKNLEADPDAWVWLNGKKRSVTGSVDRGQLTIASLEVDRKP